MSHASCCALGLGTSVYTGSIAVINALFIDGESQAMLVQQ